MGKYETVSIKVPSDLKRRASQLGIRTAEVLRRALEEEVRRREVEEHMRLITDRSGLSESEVRLVMGVIMTNIEIVSKDVLLANWSRAEEVIGSIDRDDVPSIAAALTRSCDGVWSDNGQLKMQNVVRV